MIDSDRTSHQNSNNAEKKSSSLTPKEVREFVRGAIEAANSSVEIKDKDGSVMLTIDQSLQGLGFPRHGLLTFSGSAKLDDRAVQVHEDGTVTIPLNVYDHQNSITNQLVIRSSKGPGGRFFTEEISVTIENSKRQDPVTKLWSIPRA